MSDLYAERDIIEQGNHYSRHTSAMTGEGLHSKSDIAAELAHRDIEIERLQDRIAELESVTVAYENMVAGMSVPNEFLEEENMQLKAEVFELTKKNINEEEFQRLNTRIRLLNANVEYWRDKFKRSRVWREGEIT